ncbi:Outer membrane protein OmpA [Flagellimonas zhangzhouensis]|uniref:Outer membrane protein OmpA n=2 Tax=Flagellimonas zhangzhouensis TaxID=1073328 RepID=A0A1H2YRV8_9FLAO|nr:Outer membrane protein OmpA [Allomuricauda zhangzhouensis]SDX07259.1 Outer membrane protein OmpA [Allomuricauda zhangzhouensis]
MLVIALCSMALTFAQDIELTKKDSIVQSYWLVSLGMNAVDDSGHEFDRLFDLDGAWNIVPYPSRVSVGRYFNNGLGLEAIGSYNQYQEGKIVDKVEMTEDVDYYAMDLRVSYDLNKILGETGFFDPYIGIGAGYTDANNQGRGTYNATIGFRTWFSDHWGLDFNSTGKWAMNTEKANNHIQHALAVAYRFDVEKGLSRKGMEKLALMEEMEKEQQRINDSIADAKEAERLAEQLKKEQEAAALAAAEKAKKEAEEARRAVLQNKINNLGNVYFKLNSSYLTSQDKELLDQLVYILKDEPNLKIKITAHTDSRGTEKYNQWLSERRAERTLEYLISKGISEDRIAHEAYGETQLVNECTDGVRCSEEEHSKNRRSEFKIIAFD